MKPPVESENHFDREAKAGVYRTYPREFPAPLRLVQVRDHFCKVLHAFRVRTCSPLIRIGFSHCNCQGIAMTGKKLSRPGVGCRACRRINR